MKPITAFAALACLAALPAIAADGAKPSVVAFNASVKIDVDASGKLVGIHVPDDLPEAIRVFIEKRVASWQYQPAKKDGMAVSASTFVKVGACAIPTPAGDAYRLAVDYKGNGPRIENKYERLLPPMYPREAMRRGVEARFEVVLDVHPDGSAEASSITPEEVDNRRGAMGEFEAVLRQWGRSHRFQPELVDGQPVATRVRVAVDFVLDGATSRRAVKEKIVQQALKTQECQLAGAGAAPGLEAVALDSPIKITPAPAS